MRLYFVKNLVFILSINFLVKPIWIFFIDRNVQNRVGHSEYGTYQALFNLGIIFQILLDYGLNSYNVKTLSRFPHKIGTLFPSIWTARLALSLAYSALVLSLGMILGYDGRELGLLASIMLIQILSSMVQFIRSNLAALQKFRLDGLLSITDRLIMIVIGGALLYILFREGPFRIEWFIWAQVASYAITLLLGILLLRSLAPISFKLQPQFRRLFQVLGASTPFAIHIFLMSLYTRVDMTLLERLLGPEGKFQAGIYAAAYRLLDVGNTLGIMMAGLLLPLFGRLILEKKKADPLVGVSLRLLIPFSFCLSAASIAFSPEIMDLLYRDTDQQAARVFAWVMAAFPAFCMVYIYSTLATAHGKLRPLIILAGMALIINLGLNGIWIPRHQAMGAAMAAVATQYFVGFGSLYLCWKKGLVSTSFRLVVRLLAYLLAMLGITALCRAYDGHWIIAFAAILGTGGLLLFLSGLVAPSSLKALLPHKKVEGGK